MSESLSEFGWILAVVAGVIIIAGCFTPSEAKDTWRELSRSFDFSVPDIEIETLPHIDGPFRLVGAKFYGRVSVLDSGLAFTRFRFKASDTILIPWDRLSDDFLNGETNAVEAQLRIGKTRQERIVVPWNAKMAEARKRIEQD